MRCEEYLAEDDSITASVIEEACRHLVKDRMERRGVKWTQVGAHEILYLRCLRASGFWKEFKQQRATTHHSEHHVFGQRGTAVTLYWCFSVTK